MLFLTSDTHFSDSRVLKIDKRPFKTMAEHDEALIASWNEVVGRDDEVWHLGDFARNGTNIEALLARLNGTKHLIIGNNDGPDTIAASGWASVQHYVEVTLDGQLCILCHYPFRTWNKIGKKSINLHGHSHGKLKPMTRQYDVGVDPQGLKPVTFEAVISRKRSGEKPLELNAGEN